MFIAYAKLEDGGLLVLGLSKENRQRLEDGQPIKISRESHGLAMPVKLKIMIFAGETEETMRQQMSELIDASTVVDQKRPH